MPRRGITPTKWSDFEKGLRKTGIHRKFNNYIRNGFKRDPKNFTFTIREIMNATELDFHNYYDRTRAYNYFMYHRRKIKEVMTIFWDTPEYKKYRNKGKTEKWIFDELIKAARSHNTYPMWSNRDDNYRYYLFKYYNYINLLERRMKAVVKEIDNKREIIETAAPELPEFAGREAPALLRSASPREIADALEEKIKLIAPSDRSVCPYPDCGLRFKNDTFLMEHISNTHLDVPRNELPDINTLPCPICYIPPPKGYKTMERGDYKCRECRNILTEEDLRNQSS